MGTNSAWQKDDSSRAEVALVTREGVRAVVGAAAGALIGMVLGAVAALSILGVGPAFSGSILATAIGGAAVGTLVGGLVGGLTGLVLREPVGKGPV